MDAGAQPRQETTILLLGQKQSGKSDVGNAILGMKAFNTSITGKSLILPAWAEIDTETKEYELLLVDGPDLEDMDLKKLKSKEGTCDKLGLAMGLCENGVDAVLLVLKYGDPLTEDHKVVIEAAAKMLGEKWLDNNGIVVMCGGNDWKMQNRNISFEQWCKHNNDSYGKIFSKCGYRCVLFENSKPNEEHKQKLIEDLLYWAEHIRGNNGRHTNKRFEAAAKNLETLIVKLNVPILNINIQKRTSLLTSKCMMLDIMLAYSEKMKLIGAILDRAKVLLNDIAEKKLSELEIKITELRKKAHQAERNLLEAPESLLSDFVGIKESAKIVEDMRTNLEIWLKLAEIAITGLKVGGASFLGLGLLSYAAELSLLPALGVLAVPAAVVGVSAAAYGLANSKSRPRPVEIKFEATHKLHHKITILLLGKESTGKAAVGNAILGMEAFERSATDNSLLPAWAEFDTETNEYELMVVEGPDVNDINLENMALAMGFCENGVDLFVLVTKYDDRFTEKEISILRALRNMLGSEWLSKHGVVVMTYGNTSRDEIKGISKYFTRWCVNKDASYGGFFSECKQRCFLFDIESPDMPQKLTSFQELIAVAKQMKDAYGSCKNKHFEATTANRDTLIVHLNAPIDHMEIEKKISLLTSKCTKLFNQQPYRESMKLIGAIIDRTGGLLSDIAKVDKGTGKLNKLQKNVMKLKKQAEKAEKGLREKPEARLSDFLDMQTCAELQEDMKKHPSLLIDFKRKALKGLKGPQNNLILGAAGLLVYEAGLIPMSLHTPRE